MTKSHKKDHKDRKRSRSRSPSASAASSSSSDESRSRSRSRNRSNRKRKHSSKSSKRDRRSRSRSRDRKKARKRSRSPSSSSSSSSRSRSPPVKRESTQSTSLSSHHQSSSSAATTSNSEISKKIKAEEKARLKALETPAEKAARRAAKKALKHGSTGDTTAATAIPGTSDKPFVWKKKYEKNIAEGLDVKILNRTELAQKQLALQEEIALIKLRKQQRAEEKEQMDALREQMQREAEMENIEGWEEKEEEFHRQNAKMRTEIRIKEGREKLVDVLAKNRMLWRQLKYGPTQQTIEEHPEYLGATLDPNLPPESDIELTEAWKIFTGDQVPWRDLEFLLQDIEQLRGLEREDEPYWKACIELAKQSMERQKTIAFATQQQQQQHQGRFGRPTPSPPAAASTSKSSADRLKADMALLLKGKSLAELSSLERDISGMLSGQRPSSLVHLESMDHSYWEGLKVELQAFKYEAFLREFHIDLLERRLADLQTYIKASDSLAQKQRERDRQEAIERGEDPDAAAKANAAAGESGQNMDEDDEMNFEPTLIPHAEYSGTATAAEDVDMAHEDDDDGSFSPVLYQVDEDDKLAASHRAIDAILVDPESDARDLAEQRRQVAEQRQRELDERSRLAAGGAVSVALGAPSAVAASSSAAAGSAAVPASSDDSAFRREQARGLEGDEVQLSKDFAIPSQTYWWHDRYRPRKPRFFNRVKTGFEWNKYNSTHYDKENPPPKIVQGYKFNIFYPDLIDPSVAPRYRIEPDPGGNPDFCILRFMAGPPYEDLAFKIVKKEWEHSFKRGYKCVFDRGTLQLYFNFRRYFYRR